MDDARLGSDSGERDLREKQLSRRQAYFAGWTLEEYEIYLETGSLPKRDEREPHRRRTDSVY